MKNKRAADVRQNIVRIGPATGACIDILDQDRARGRAVALPQLIAVNAIVGIEKQRAVDVRQRVRSEPLPLPT